MLEHKKDRRAPLTRPPTQKGLTHQNDKRASAFNITARRLACKKRDLPVLSARLRLLAEIPSANGSLRVRRTERTLKGESPERVFMPAPVKPNGGISNAKESRPRNSERCA
jgi:hypothetical protein